MSNVNAKVLSTFKDAGTNEEFEAGKTVELPAGQFKNYEAAGLVEKAGAKSDTKADTTKA